MTYIKAIASYIPNYKIDNVSQGESFGKDEDFIRNKIGAVSLPRKKIEEETSDLAVSAIHQLVKDSELSLDIVDALIVVTQNGDGEGLPHTAAIVHKKLGLNKQVATFDISLGCSGYVYALSIVQGFMHTTGLKNALLVTADPYSKVIDPLDRMTTLLFADAATVTWLSADGMWRICPPLFGTNGEGASYLQVSDSTLTMNGRQIFNFAVQEVPLAIKECLDTYQLQLEDVDMYCLHQGSAAIINSIAKIFPSIEERFINKMLSTGNTVSSTIPLVLEEELWSKNHERVLISGFGVGLSWATTILERRV